MTSWEVKFYNPESLQECDNINKLILKQAEEVQAESSRIRNDQISRISTRREKSFDKSRDKSLHKEKSSKNFNPNAHQTNQPTLTKNKTVANFRKDDLKTSMTKQKSNLNLHADSSSK